MRTQGKREVGEAVIVAALSAVVTTLIQHVYAAYQDKVQQAKKRDKGKKK